MYFGKVVTEVFQNTFCNTNITILKSAFQKSQLMFWILKSRHNTFPIMSSRMCVLARKQNYRGGGSKYRGTGSKKPT